MMMVIAALLLLVMVRGSRRRPWLAVSVRPSPTPLPNVRADVFAVRRRHARRAHHAQSIVSEGVTEAALAEHI